MKRLSIGLGMKIAGGFAIMLVFLFVLGLISYNGMRSLVVASDSAKDSLEAELFISNKLSDHLLWLKDLEELFLNHDEFEGQLDPKQCGFGKWYYSFLDSAEYKKLPSDIKNVIDDIEGYHASLHNSARSITSKFHIFDETLVNTISEAEIAHLNWMNHLAESIILQQIFALELDSTQCGFGKWYYGFEQTEDFAALPQSLQKYFLSIKDPHQKLHDSGRTIQALERQGNYSRALTVYMNQSKPVLEQLQQIFHEFKSELDRYYGDNLDAKDILVNQTFVSVSEVQRLFGMYSEYLTEQKNLHNSTAERIEKTVLFLLVILTLVILGLGIIIAIILTRSITKPLIKISGILNKSSSQIAEASDQLSKTSQEIANGTMEQASSIEETSSSMEELAAMVMQNTNNAKESSSLVNNAAESSQRGQSQMLDMMEAMSELNKSSDKIKNVIDVIDKIAFQTNLLALNAAVEAARAGEAGMGFAVVANEVKNLANLSAEAAKETSELIEDSIKKTGAGLETANRLSEIFKEIIGNTEKVLLMSKEIELASVQQDTGIGQVNKAVIQLDQVVQSNATATEESASSAEELSSQVVSLKGLVDELVILIRGKADGSTAISQRVNTMPDTGIEYRVPKTNSSVKPRKRDVSSDELIPFDEDKEFSEVD